MFPRLREQIGTALDVLVEFSTLGEYRLAVDALGTPGTPADAPGQAPQLGGAPAQPLRAAVRHTVAGGAAGETPVATPAARRLMGNGKAAANAPKAAPPAHATCRAERRRTSEPAKRTPSRQRARNGASKAPEQLCLAV
jgi:hypothetical protein